MNLHQIPKENSVPELSDVQKLVAIAYTNDYAKLQVHIRDNYPILYYHGSGGWNEFPKENFDGWVRQCKAEGLTTAKFNFEQHIKGGVVYETP